MDEDAEVPAATILVAEDDADIRDLFTMALEAAGAAVVAVNSGGEALDALRDRPFDLVVTDMWMPKVSGLDLCKAMRADPATAELPILMLSAYGKLRGREEALLAGATEYLTKPIRPSALVGKADALLKGRLTARSD